MDDLLRAERDSFATLGVLARAYLLFDVPIELKSAAAPTHFRGLNVHCLIIDNSDGEVLAVERNAIHAEESPLEHAEQRAVRAAILRIKQKRPREAHATVEDYYKQSMFMAQGTEPSDFLRKGCTLYNMFDPCAMCAVTLLIAYMKRIAYVLEDHKFAGFYQRVKSDYFSSRESLHGRVFLSSEETPLATQVRELLASLDLRVAELLRKHVDLINVLDSSRDHLAKAMQLLQSASHRDLRTTGDDKLRNSRTLTDIKRACNLPVEPMQ